MEKTSKKFEEYWEKIQKQREELQKRIVGLNDFIESLFICFYAHSERKLGPHLLVEGKVGKGKTVTLDTFAKTIGGAKFSRIQFTPDLRPMDLIRIVEQCENRSLEFHEGPLFANLILADEINRAHEKTRAALLEAMGEKQITLGKKTYALEEPFFVMATENPIDVEGTFMLGAAQLDRFMMKINVDPLSEEEELSIAKSQHEKEIKINEVITKIEVLEIQKFIRQNIYLDPKLRKDIIRIVRTLRPEGHLVSPEDFYMLPEGERGYLFLERGAKVRAFLKGREYVLFSDFADIAFSILNHRIRFKYGSQENTEDQMSKELISKALDRVVENAAKGL